MNNLSLHVGDALDVLKTLPSESVQCCVTSPPYWGLRDYGVAGQMGLESTPEAYIAGMVKVFNEVKRALKDDGTLWLNLGDSYTSGGRDYRDPGKSEMNGGGRVAGLTEKGKRPPIPQGLKPKDLVGIPWMVAFALRANGWYLRSDIIWNKPNPMPESVTDRPTKSHEYLFLLTKSEKYYYDQEAIKEPSTGQNGQAASFQRNTKDHRIPNQTAIQHRMDREPTLDDGTRNKRSVWTVATAPYPEAHFATYPPDLIKPCILAGTRPGDVVLDPFAGSGTTGMVALEYGRKALLIELNQTYAELIKQRCDVTPGLGL